MPNEKVNRENEITFFWLPSCNFHPDDSYHSALTDVDKHRHCGNADVCSRILNHKGDISMAENDSAKNSPGPLTQTEKASESSGQPQDFNAAEMLRDIVNKVPDTITKAVERALNVRDTTVLVRLSDASSDSVDKLVSAGVFKSRAEATSFLVDEGIKAQAAIFERIESKMAEIERLRSELRESVKP
jgi:hypothetical protein